MALNKPNFEAMDETQGAAQTIATGAGAAAAEPVKQAEQPVKQVEQSSTDKPAAAAAETATIETTTGEKLEVDQGTGEILGTSSTTALEPAKTSALAAPRADAPSSLISQSNILDKSRDQLRVTWEDFDSINATNGNFAKKDPAGGTPKVLGDYLELQVVSSQEQYVVAPEDQDAEGEGLVKYSDDGVVLNDGSGKTVKEHLEFLKDNDTPGKMSHRLVVVGELQHCNDAGQDLIGNLVQVVLADNGRRSFNSHAKQSGYHISQGRISAQDATFVGMTTNVAGTGKKSYTAVTVGYTRDRKPRVGGLPPQGTVELVS